VTVALDRGHLSRSASSDDGSCDDRAARTIVPRARWPLEEVTKAEPEEVLAE